jgi:uncharacterized membrane protein
MVHLFTRDEEARIVEAIRLAELKTSGEIRVHIEKRLEKSALEDAKQTFQRLKMHETRDRNGVLILLAPIERTFAIIGDKGIDERVPAGFWDAERDLMADYFRKGKHCEGLVLVIDQIGDRLQEFFPITEDDTNELSNEISYGGSDDKPS